MSVLEKECQQIRLGILGKSTTRAPIPFGLAVSIGTDSASHPGSWVRLDFRDAEGFERFANEVLRYWDETFVPPRDGTDGDSD